MSYADQVFIENCRQIIDHGSDNTGMDVRPRWEDGTPAYTRKSFGIVNRYDLQREFPIQTIRKINYKAAIDELLWIWQMKSNRVADLNSRIWDSWAGEDGTIGKAYGYQMGLKYDFPEGKNDQVDHVRYQLKHDRASRRIMTSMYNFRDLEEMNLYPCAYSMTFNVSDNKLNAILNQRSQDMLVANNWNVVQYSALIIFLAKEAGLEPGELVHVISDAHIYDRHIPIVEEVLTREQHVAPTVLLGEEAGDFMKVTADTLELIGYKHSGLIKGIPVAI